MQPVPPFPWPHTGQTAAHSTTPSAEASAPKTPPASLSSWSPRELPPDDATNLCSSVFEEFAAWGMAIQYLCATSRHVRHLHIRAVPSNHEDCPGAERLLCGGGSLLIERGATRGHHLPRRAARLQLQGVKGTMTRVIMAHPVDSTPHHERDQETERLGKCMVGGCFKIPHSPF